MIYSEEEGIVVDDLCPMKDTVSKDELKLKGVRVVEVLKRIDSEAKAQKQVF